MGPLVSGGQSAPEIGLPGLADPCYNRACKLLVGFLVDPLFLKELDDYRAIVEFSMSGERGIPPTLPQIAIDSICGLEYALETLFGARNRSDLREGELRFPLHLDVCYDA